METKEYHTVDKTGWPRGPWDNEPDKKQWPDPATGLPCLAVRGPGGHWCGYVGVLPGSVRHGVDYDSVPYEEGSVHWGLTFSARCADTANEAKHVCRVPGDGEPKDVWWFGFDCGHSGDLSPKYESRLDGVYRDLAFVEREVTRLAEQLAQAA